MKRATTTTTKSKVNESERKSKIKTATTATIFHRYTEYEQNNINVAYCNLYALTASVRLLFCLSFGCCFVFTASVYRLQCPFLNLVVFRGVFFLFASSLSAGSLAYLFVWFGRQTILYARLVRDSLDSALSLFLCLINFCVWMSWSQLFNWNRFVYGKKLNVSSTLRYLPLSVVVVAVCAVFPHCTTTKSERNRIELQAWIQHTDTACTNTHAHSNVLYTY